MKWINCASLVAVSLVAVHVASAQTMPAALPAQGQVRLTLRNALWRPDAVTDLLRARHEQADLVLDLERRAGQWAGEVWGYARWYNRADHTGRITRTEATESGVRLTIAMSINPDQWIAGGEGLYVVEVKQQEGKLAGSFTGTFNGRGVAGEVTGSVGPTFLGPVEGQLKFGAGEHPRLLFRKEDLAALRERAKSPAWQKTRKALEKEWALAEAGFGYGMFHDKPQAMQGTEGMHAASHALCYVLEQDKAQADQAKALARVAMSKGCAQDEIWGYVGQIHAVALAYDLCFDAWDEPFKRETRAWLMRWASTIARPRALRPQGNQSLAVVNFNPYSSDLAAFRAASGIAALAVMGDLAADEQGVAAAPLAIKPAEGYTPGKDVPVVAFSHDTVMTQWLNLSGLVEDPAWRPGVAELQKDPLEAMGGPEKLRPESGTKVEYRDSKGMFEPLDSKYVFTDAYTDGRPAVALLRPVHDKGQSIDYYYAVLKNDKARLVRVDLGDRYIWAERIWLNGTSVSENQVVQLEAGLYPLLIQARVPTRQTYSPYFPAFYGNTKYPHRDGRRGNWHYQTLVVDDGVLQQYPKADLWMMPRLIESGDPRTQASAAAYARSGEMIEPSRVAAIAARSVGRYLDAAWGERGWGPEDECDGDAIQYVWHFLSAYRSATGRTLPIGHTLESFLPVLAYRADLDTEYARSQFVAARFARDVDRPLVRHLLDQAIDGWGTGGWMQFPEFAVYMLVSYPFEVEAKGPADLKMPLTYEDKSAGGYVFRRGWDQADPLVIVRGSTKVNHNAAIAGDFTIRGLGTWWGARWAPGEGVISYPVPGQHNVLMVDGALPVGGAIPLGSESGADGSGWVSFDMSRVYFGARPRKTNIAEMMSRGGYGSLGLGVDWGDGGPFDAGIRASRTVAADYSGTSGAPALFVVVDQLEGDRGAGKVWRLGLPVPNNARGDKAVFLGDGFVDVIARAPDSKARKGETLATTRPAGAGEKHLRLTFVVDGQMKVELRNSRIEATTTAGQIVAVMTLGEGPAPAVGRAGERELVIGVGGQRVRVAGGKVVFGK